MKSGWSLWQTGWPCAHSQTFQGITVHLSSSVSDLPWCWPPTWLPSQSLYFSWSISIGIWFICVTHTNQCDSINLQRIGDNSQKARWHGNNDKEVTSPQIRYQGSESLFKGITTTLMQALKQGWTEKKNLKVLRKQCLLHHQTFQFQWWPEALSWPYWHKYLHYAKCHFYFYCLGVYFKC